MSLAIGRDVAAASVVVLMGIAALLVSRRDAPAPRPEGPVPSDAAAPAGAGLSLTYRREGAPTGLLFVEVRLAGETEAEVRYQVEGGPPRLRAVPLADAQRARLLGLLESTRFFEAEELGRPLVGPGAPRLLLRASLDGRTNELLLDGRTRSSFDLAPLLAWLDALWQPLLPEAPAG